MSATLAKARLAQRAANHAVLTRQGAARSDPARFAWSQRRAVLTLLEHMARQRTEEGRRVGARIAELRDRHHLTQEAAAQALAVGHRTYQAWEAGESVPRWSNRVKLAALFDVTPEEILGPVSPPVAAVILAELEQRLAAVEARLSQLAPAGDDAQRPASEAPSERGEVVAGALGPLLDEAESPRLPAPGPPASRRAATRRKRA